MHPLETYLRDLQEIRSTGAGVKETSYYPPLANLLNAVGQQLRPRVRCVINLKNQGAGLPDRGLFTPDQFQKGADDPLDGQPPARGPRQPLRRVPQAGDAARRPAPSFPLTRSAISPMLISCDGNS